MISIESVNQTEQTAVGASTPVQDCLVRLNRSRITIAIPFLYREVRLQYLARVLSTLRTIPCKEIYVHVSTNAKDKNEIETLARLLSTILQDAQHCIHSLSLTDNRLLGWHHKTLLKNFVDSSSGELFIYTEDDIEIGLNNLLYFLRFRSVLDANRLVPAFIRLEYNSSSNFLYPVDFGERDNISSRESFQCNSLKFVNVINPYMGCYVMDKKLAEEHIDSDFFHMEKSAMRSSWGILERANMGVCFDNPPEGYSSRYVLPFKQGSTIPYFDAWIYHLPNNYTNSNGVMGQIPLDSVFY